MQYCKVEIESGDKPCHFPHKIVGNCAKTNVQVPNSALDYSSTSLDKEF